MLFSTLFSLALLGVAAADSKGDTVCVALMCISANVTGDTAEYTLKGSGARQMAWMAMGFGSTMANSPMVIMWPNSDGSITLSQRMAPAEIMPTVVASPPRTATVLPKLSDFTATQPTLSFSIPANTDAGESVIWAFGTNAPSGAAVDAQILQHLDSGTFKLDLTKALAGSGTTTSSAGSTSPTSGSSPSDIPAYDDALQPYQMKLVAHGILSFIGFLCFLPLGTLIARYFRTVSPGWFVGHWVAQSALSGPIIIAGVALGINATPSGTHLVDTHKKLGVALLVLYLFQVLFGAVIHFLKPKSSGRRPAQNYVHAVLGLLIIALAFYQVHLGYDFEWPTTTGRDPVPRAVNIVWIVWVVLLPLLYVVGLSFLPKQFKKEKESNNTMQEKHET